jgi:4-carboxymuconolactone decarboxylase
MSSTTRAKRVSPFACAMIAAIAVGLSHPLASAAAGEEVTTMSSGRDLSAKRQIIILIPAATALGDMPQLDLALNRGLDAGLTVSDSKEISVQLFAYTASRAA